MKCHNCRDRHLSFFLEKDSLLMCNLKKIVTWRALWVIVASCLTLMQPTQTDANGALGPTLQSADLVVIARNTDLDDQFALVALANIPGNSVIFLTDEGWDDSDFTFDGAEDVFKWTVHANGISAGTIIRFTNASTTTLEILNSQHGTVVSVNGSSDMNLSAGDQLFIYQTANDTYSGTIQRKTAAGGVEAGMIYAFNGDNSSPSTYGWLVAGNAHTSAASQAPDNMTVVSTSDGSGNAATGNAFGMLTQASLKQAHNGTQLNTPGPADEYDNYKYDGPTTQANKTTWLTRFHTTANWIAHDADTLSISNISDLSITSSGANSPPKIAASDSTNAITQVAGPVAKAASPFDVTGFDKPVVLASDDLGNVYVSSQNAKTIVKIDAQGDTTTVSDVIGSLPAQGLVYAGSGELFVSTRDDGVVKRVSAQGVVSDYITSLNGPEALAKDNAYLYIVESGANKVIKVDAQGNKTDFATGFSYPVSMAISSSGNLYVGDMLDNKIVKVDAQGNKTDFVTGIRGPRALACDSSGNLYATTGTHKLIRYDSQGNNPTELITSEIDNAFGLTVDKYDNIYVASQWNDKVVKVSSVSVQDNDSADFNTGVLTVSVQSGDSQDSLYVNNEGNGTGQIDFDAQLGSVSYNSNLIGSVTGGVGSTPLTVNLTSSANASSVTALLRNIYYKNLGVV